jgi:hypothetical protein
LIVAVIGIGGYLVNYRLEIRLEKYRNRIKAAQEFRDCFINNLKGLYPQASKWPTTFLAIDPMFRAIFPELQGAVERFRHFVPLYRRWCFDRAWVRYYNADKNTDCQNYDHYKGFQGDPDPQEQFRHNVDLLLSFAKYH